MVERRGVDGLEDWTRTTNKQSFKAETHQWRSRSLVGRAHHLVLQAVLPAWWGFHHERSVYRDGVANAQQCCVRGSKTASASEGARGTRTPDIPRRAAEDSFHPLTRPSCSTSSCQRSESKVETLHDEIALTLLSLLSNYRWNKIWNRSSRIFDRNGAFFKNKKIRKQDSFNNFFG